MCLNIPLACTANIALWFWSCNALLPVAVREVKTNTFFAFKHPVTSKQLQRRLWRPFTFPIQRKVYCSLQNYTKVFCQCQVGSSSVSLWISVRARWAQPTRFTASASTSAQIYFSGKYPYSHVKLDFYFWHRREFGFYQSFTTHKKCYMLPFSLLTFRRGNKVKKSLSQIYQLHFQLLYHRWIYKLSFRKMSQNMFLAIMALSLKLNCKCIADIFL